MQYFIDAGAVGLHVDGRHVGTVEQGEFFGEGALPTIRGLVDAALRQDPHTPSTPILRASGGPAAPDISLPLLRREPSGILRTKEARAQGQCRCLELTVTDILSVFKDELAGLTTALR